MEDDFRLNATLYWRQPSLEDNLHLKPTVDGRGPLLEDTLWWKTSFDGNILRWKTPWIEYILRWETTFNGRRLLMEDDLQWKRTLDQTKQTRSRIQIDFYAIKQMTETQTRLKIDTEEPILVFFMSLITLVCNVI